MAVYNGINGKITLSGAVVGGFNSATIAVDRNVAEFGAIGSQTFEIAAGLRSANFTLNGAWAGSRFLPILQGTGSNWSVIMEISGGATIIGSGCLATGGEWAMNAGEITTDSLTGRCVDVYASGTSLN